MEDAVRYRLSLLYNIFIRFIFQTQVQDNLSGFFALRREALRRGCAYRRPHLLWVWRLLIRLLLVAWRHDWRILRCRCSTSCAGTVTAKRAWHLHAVYRCGDQLRLRGI